MPAASKDKQKGGGLLEATKQFLVPRLVKRGFLTVAVQPSFAGVAYVGESGKIEGLDADILHSFGEAMGLKVRFLRAADFVSAIERPGEWPGERDAADVACGGIGPSFWRVAFIRDVEWTIPYYSVKRTVVYNVSDPIRRFPDDVTGRVRGVMGSTGFDNAYKLLSAAGREELLEDSDDEKRDVRLLLSGKIQGVMRGTASANSLVKAHPGKLKASKPWVGDPVGDSFCFVTRAGVGLDTLLTCHLTDLRSDKRRWSALLRKHGLV